MKIVIDEWMIYSEEAIRDLADEKIHPIYSRGI